MKAIGDPEGAEVRHLINACELSGKTVLEVGCGEGKLTRQYAEFPSRLIGLDPDRSDLLVASGNKGSTNSLLLQSIGEKMPFPYSAFGVVIFASSL
jgi:ubiquinone/menaquinone biosynthesis C-methylase UbiE